MATLRTFDDLKLHLQEWPVAHGAHGTVQVVHGLGEHIGRYAGLASRLNDRGWHVVGHDQRGHGRSEGPRGTVPSGEVLLQEIAQVMDQMRRPGPYVLLGHSLGGLLAARFVAESVAPQPAQWQREVDGLVLSSPALDIGLSARRKRLLALAARLVPNLRLDNGLRSAWISREPSVVKAYRLDQLVHDRITPRLAQFMVDAGATVQARATQWELTTLLMWAGADLCVAPEGSEAFAELSPPEVVTALAFPNLYHEIFNEPERAHVFRHLAQWLARFETDDTEMESAP